MTTSQIPGVDDPRSPPAPSCPCGHGEVGAEIDQQRPLVIRALAGDGDAFGGLYDAHVDDVYRYLLAWTGGQTAARELTEQVFHGALTWLPVIAGGEGDLGAWLITLARDAVVQHRGTGWVDGQVQADGQTQDVFKAVEQLDDAQREVVVLRLLLGHSAAHTAHLAGYSRRAVHELQLAACSTLWYLLSGMPVDQPPPGHEEARARWFEHCLSGVSMDLRGDQGLANAVATAGALVRTAPGRLPPPDGAFVGRLRDDVLHALGEGPEAPSKRSGKLVRAFGFLRFHVARHPWAATVVAFTAIGLIFGLQLASGSATRATCRGGPCSAPATVASTLEAGVTIPSLPTDPMLGQESSTSAPVGVATSSTSTQGNRVPTTIGAPSTTAPPTTAPKTTRSTRAPATTRRSTTTGSSTSSSTTTTSSTTPPPQPPGGPVP